MDDHGRAVGETVWAARLADDRLIGAAWEWVEVLPGVPAIRDPNGIISNLRLLDEAGQDLEELQTIVGMNRIAHAMPWQQAVVRVVRGEATVVAHDAKRSGRRKLGGHAEVEASEVERMQALLASLPRRQAGAKRAAAVVG